MDADQPLKMLFRPRAADLLGLTGDRVHACCRRVSSNWEFDPREMLRLGPGPATLVGALCRADLKAVERAAGCIRRRAPVAQRSDLLAILRVLSEGRYTASQLARVIPRKDVMASSLFAEARRLGRAEGRAEGALDAHRRSLHAILRRRHPELATRMAGVVGRCNDVALLEQWVVVAGELTADELVKLMSRRPSKAPLRRRVAAPKPVARRRAARPARRSTKAAAGR